jgi:hypothetical protein
MSDRATLLDLASRVEALAAPSREIDAEVWCALHPGWTPHAPTGWAISPDNLAGIVREYTASLDAALALMAEVMPGHFGGITLRGVWAGAHLYSEPQAADIVYGESAARPACAMVAAVLRAVAATRDPSVPA